MSWFRNSKTQICCYVLASLVIGFLLGSFSQSQKYQNYISSTKILRYNNSEFPFVRQTLGTETPNALSINQFKPLANAINDVVAKNKTDLERYSVYFRDLNSGRWAGINENDKYDPASILKVAIAVAVYKEAEDAPFFLNEQKMYTQSLAKINTSPYDEPSKLTVGAIYSVQDLVQKMLVSSDNGAMNVLLATVDQTILNDVYNDLSITPPDGIHTYLISSKSYSLFFRVLYGSTYLKKEYSNTILGLLSSAEFKDGLVAGIPSDAKIAHKFGEHVISNTPNAQDIELHDCGIVYHPAHPYLICVMTQGKNVQSLESFISQVSKAVYDSASADYK